MYNKTTVAALGNTAAATRLERKPIGAEAVRHGLQFEEVWSVYQLAKMASASYFELVNGGDENKIISDNRIVSRNLQCFVDDLDITRNGFRFFYQLKTGENIPWPEVDYDFWAQRVLDDIHRIYADYVLVVESERSFQKSRRHIEKITRLGFKPYDIVEFQFDIDFGPLLALQPKLAFYLEVITGTKAKDVQLQKYSEMLLLWKTRRSVVIHWFISTRFKRRIAPSRPILSRIIQALVYRGFGCGICGEHIEISKLGFTGRFLVPFKERDLNRFYQRVVNPLKSDMDVIDWLVGKGW